MGSSNATAILIERIFWLGLGGFLVLAIISSLTREIGEKEKTISQKELKNIAKKATQRNKLNK
tara:strand:+ start:315 stop:503 length:189 start_codon:yes stop_codon:yes gene_type:complete